MIEWILLLILLLGLAALAGFLAGLLGIGGGLVLVPGLYFIFTLLDYSGDNIMHLAVGTSLATIIATGFSSARAHWKREGVRFDLVKKIGIGIVIGVCIGTLIADNVSSFVLQVIFAVALTGFAFIMQLNPEKIKLYDDVPNQPWPAIAGTFIGTIATLMGIGGAALNVPYMTLNNVSIQKAIGTASAIGLLVAIPGVLGFLIIGWGNTGNLPPYSFGYINLLAVAIIVPITVLTAPLGVKFAHYVSTKTLRRIFSIFMIIIALRMIFEALNAG